MNKINNENEQELAVEFDLDVAESTQDNWEWVVQNFDLLSYNYNQFLEVLYCEELGICYQSIWDTMEINHILINNVYNAMANQLTDYPEIGPAFEMVAQMKMQLDNWEFTEFYNNLDLLEVLVVTYGSDKVVDFIAEAKEDIKYRVINAGRCHDTGETVTSDFFDRVIAKACNCTCDFAIA